MMSLKDKLVSWLLTIAALFFIKNNEIFNECVKSMAESKAGAKTALEDSIYMLNDNLYRDISITVVFIAAGLWVAYVQLVELHNINAGVMILTFIVLTSYLLYSKIVSSLYAGADYLFIMLKLISYEKQSPLDEKADARNIRKLLESLGVSINENK